MKQRILLLLACLLLLAGCSQEPAETTPPAPPPVEHVTMVVTADTIGLLEEYPDLRSVDLSGSTCYEAIFQYMQNHPKVAVTYTVQLGTLTVSEDETDLILDPGVCDYETLVANLRYLPKVTRIQLPRSPYTAQELAALEGLFPQITWDYSVILLGQEVTKATEELNLSVLTSEQVADTAAMVANFPNITRLELMDAYGQCELTKGEVALLMDALPNAAFHYVFELFGKTLSTDETRLEYVGIPIGNEGAEQIREALTVLRGCEYLLLDDCGIDSQILAQIRDEFRETTQVVWRVRFGEKGAHSYLTDTDTIRAVYGVTDKTSGELAYCENVKYLDLRQNGGLTDLSFIASMPELEICILSGCPIENLDAFAGLEKLIFLEVAHCTPLTDISALAGCVALEHLNLSYTGVTDISVLTELPLKQFCAVMSQIPFSQQTALTEAKPDCAFRFEGKQAYGTGWYYTKSGIKTEIYATVCEIFGLES